MSYSFAVRAASATALVAAATVELDKAAEAQPIHRRDREATDAALNGLLELVAEPDESHELSASIAGSCYGPEGEPFQGITLSIHISTLSKMPS